MITMKNKGKTTYLQEISRSGWEIDLERIIRTSKLFGKADGLKVEADGVECSNPDDGVLNLEISQKEKGNLKWICGYREVIFTVTDCNNIALPEHEMTITILRGMDKWFGPSVKEHYLILNWGDAILDKHGELSIVCSDEKVGFLMTRFNADNINVYTTDGKKKKLELDAMDAIVYKGNHVIPCRYFFKREWENSNVMLRAVDDEHCAELEEVLGKSVHITWAITFQKVEYPGYRLERQADGDVYCNGRLIRTFDRKSIAKAVSM